MSAPILVLAAVAIAAVSVWAADVAQPGPPSATPGSPVAQETPPAQTVPEVGQPIPDVSAVNQAGETVRLGSFKGRHGVVVFFFPKAFTPGCTMESCGFRDEFAGFETRGYVILGVSRDSPEELKRFKEKYGLPYQLLSDPQGALARALGVEPGSRQTVVISREGTVEHRLANFTPATHPRNLLGEIEKAWQK